MIDDSENMVMTSETAGLFFSVFERTSFTINDPTFTELIATGNIELIRIEEPGTTLFNIISCLKNPL